MDPATPPLPAGDPEAPEVPLDAAGAGPEAPDDPATRILEAALPNVAFDGWSDTTLIAAAKSADVAPALARALYPRGGVDLALAFHRAGDRRMAERLAGSDLTAMRYSERVAFAIRTRLEVVEDRELARRGTTLFALPQHAADGARAIWGTADAIWRALGDTSSDFNFYSKRATLSAVYAACVLYWLGDDSLRQIDTRAFIDRRISDVMRIEKLKATLRDNPLTRALRTGPLGSVMAAAERFRPPFPTPPGGAPGGLPPDLPGRMRP